MKYFFDTEFLEGSQKRFFGLSETKPTIDLISIGIVSEDGRKYYATSKDFNLKEAWNRYDLKVNKGFPNGPEYLKEYWIRENVLKPIWTELRNRYLDATCEHSGNYIYTRLIVQKFSYSSLKFLIKTYGKSNRQIAFEIVQFTLDPTEEGYRDWLGSTDEYYKIITERSEEQMPEFYAYYSAYDWVAFCWIFGKMIDLPKGFPMYCRDLKQMLDEKCEERKKEWLKNSPPSIDFDMLSHVKSLPNYPTQDNAHNALDDAEWNLELYNFIQKL